MNKFSATFKDGTVATRNSKRDFTHAILTLDTLWGNRPWVYWASSESKAHNTGRNATRSGYQSYEIAEARKI